MNIVIFLAITFIVFYGIQSLMKRPKKISEVKKVLPTMPAEDKNVMEHSGKVFLKSGVAFIAIIGAWLLLGSLITGLALGASTPIKLLHMLLYFIIPAVTAYLIIKWRWFRTLTHTTNINDDFMGITLCVFFIVIFLLGELYFI